MGATIKDICQATGFSTATVSRVLHNSPLVTEETRRRVTEAMQQLGYQPNHAARALKLNRTGMIAVVFPELDNGFFTHILRGIDEMASEFDVHLMTAFTHGPHDEQDLITRLVQERRADALILMNLTFQEDFLQKLKKSKLPIVLIDRPMKKGGLLSVGIDNRAGAAAMTQHLIDHGYQRIAFVAGPENTYDARERLLAFRTTMRKNKKLMDESLIWKGDFTEEGGVRVMEEYLRAGRPFPDAIFAGNDAMAAGIHSVLRARQVRVPEEVALVGFDDTDLARHLNLTTIHVPMKQIGRAAARHALDLIEGREATHPNVLPTRLIVRGSCGCDPALVPGSRGEEKS